MATTAQAALQDSGEKENRPPKKVKKTVSVAGLFSQRQGQKADYRASDVLAPRPSGVSKTQVTKPGFFKQFHSRNPESHPLYRNFAEAVACYKDGVAAFRYQQLEPVFNELKTRVDGLGIDGQPVVIPGMPSNGELDTLVNTEKELTKPLDDERMTVQTRKRNGVVENRDVKVGDTMHVFQNLLEKKRTELQELLGELRGVDDEIAEAISDIVQTEQAEVKKAKDDLNTGLAALFDKARSAKAQTKADIRKAQKEEKAQLDHFNDRLTKIME